MAQAGPPGKHCAEHELRVTLIQSRVAVSCLEADEPVTAAKLRAALTEGEETPYYPGAMLLRPASVNQAVEIDGGTEQLALTLMQMRAFDLQDSWLSELLGRCYQRVPIALDVVTVQREPAHRSLFQAGDIVFVPDLPDWVAVYGAVGSPGRYPFDATQTARDFVERAGGVADGGHLGDAFVYTPDGRYLPLTITHWNYEPQRVPPGSIIVVPPWRDEARQWIAELRGEVEAAPEPCER